MSLNCSNENSLPGYISGQGVSHCGFYPYFTTFPIYLQKNSKSFFIFVKYAHNREFILFVQFLQPVADIFPKIKDCTPFYFPVYSPFFLVSVIILLFSFFPDGYLPYETLIPGSCCQRGMFCYCLGVPAILPSSAALRRQSPL